MVMRVYICPAAMEVDIYWPTVVGADIYRPAAMEVDIYWPTVVGVDNHRGVGYWRG